MVGLPAFFGRSPRDSGPYPDIHGGNQACGCGRKLRGAKKAVVQAILAKNSVFDLTIVTRRTSAHKVPAGVKTVLAEAYDEGEMTQGLLKAFRGRMSLFQHPM